MKDSASSGNPPRKHGAAHPPPPNQSSRIVGGWRITEVEGLDKCHLDGVGEATITFRSDRTGELHFGHVHGAMTYRLVKREGRPAAEWSWEGTEKDRSAQGRGWATLQPDGTLTGVILTQPGVSTSFRAKRRLDGGASQSNAAAFLENNTERATAKPVVASSDKNSRPTLRRLDKELTLDLGNGVAVKLVLIPAGKFLMGSPKRENLRNPDETQHEVIISKPFYMGIYTVTQEQYETFMGKNPSGFRYSKGATYPVECVSWYDATAFCEKLSQKTGRAVALPSEAQWEYACRAGTTTPFHTGETISTDQANYRGDQVYGDGREGEFRQRPTPVGTFRPNAWGLYDMHGNLLQWCADWYGEDYYVSSPRTDPQGPNNGQDRVLRGGCWAFDPWWCRSAARGSLELGFRDFVVSFRVAVLPGLD